MWQKRSLKPRLCPQSPPRPRWERGHLAHRRHLQGGEKGSGYSPQLWLGTSSWRTPSPQNDRGDPGERPTSKSPLTLNSSDTDIRQTRPMCPALPYTFQGGGKIKDPAPVLKLGTWERKDKCEQDRAAFCCRTWMGTGEPTRYRCPFPCRGRRRYPTMRLQAT